MEIKDILEPSEYDSLNQFTSDDIEWINGRINTRRNGEPGIECVVRGKNNDGDYFKLTPEEIVRQYYGNYTRAVSNVNARIVHCCKISDQRTEGST